MAFSTACNLCLTHSRSDRPPYVRICAAKPANVQVVHLAATVRTTGNRQVTARSPRDGDNSTVGRVAPRVSGSAGVNSALTTRTADDDGKHDRHRPAGRHRSGRRPSPRPRPPPRLRGGLAAPRGGECRITPGGEGDGTHRVFACRGGDDHGAVPRVRARQTPDRRRPLPGRAQPRRPPVRHRRRRRPLGERWTESPGTPT